MTPPVGGALILGEQDSRVSPLLTAADYDRRRRVGEYAYTIWQSLPKLSWADADLIAEAVVRHDEIRAGMHGEVEADRLHSYVAEG